MIIMDGLLLTPDRGSIIGRAAWKPRYITLGSYNLDSKIQNNLSSQTEKSARLRIGLKSISKPDLTDMSDVNEDHTQIYLSVFKSKGEWEHLAQHPISAFQSCDVRSIQHRKQSTTMPTLAIDLKSDPISMKQRKRRSSRAGLTLKDGCPNTLLFRSVDGERNTIYDWVVQIKMLLSSSSLLSSTEYGEYPANNFSSSLINYTNPFLNTSSSCSNWKPDSQDRLSNQIQSLNVQNSSGKYPDIISPSPSLRSKRSDLSSQASSLAKLSTGFTTSLGYSGGLPTEISSPVSTYGNDSQSIENWSPTQGRISSLSSHTRGSNSVTSAITTPAPRETILDRAFQMRYIPGTELISSVEDVDKLSSTARFEALMREQDERKQANLDSCSKFVSSSDYVEEITSLGDIGEDSEDDLYTSDQGTELPTSTQIGLGLTTSGLSMSTEIALSPPPKTPTPFLNSQALSALSGDVVSVDDRDFTKPRADTLPRRNVSRPTTLAIPIRSFSSSYPSTLKEHGSNHLCCKIDAKEKRRSSIISVKRLSFQEFARRLSSTSSLLLVQTSASTNSGKGTSDHATDFTANCRSCHTKDDRDQRCGWRGSVGAFGVDGTFL